MIDLFPSILLIVALAAAVVALTYLEYCEGFTKGYEEGFEVGSHNASRGKVWFPSEAKR